MHYYLHHLIRHNAVPFKFFLAASWISKICLSPVLMNMLSAGCNGLMNRTASPDANAFTSVAVKLTFLLGFRINEKLRITDWLLRYLRPSHNLLVAMLSGVTSTGYWSGPDVEPFCTDDINPSLYKPSAIWRCNRLKGMDVVAALTFVQFFIWLHKCAKWTYDMIVQSKWKIFVAI